MAYTVIAHSRLLFSITGYYSPYKGLCITTRVCRPPACIKTSFQFRVTEGKKIISCFSDLWLQEQSMFESHKILIYASIVYHTVISSLAIITEPVNCIFSIFLCYQLHDKYLQIKLWSALIDYVKPIMFMSTLSVKKKEGTNQINIFLFCFSVRTLCTQIIVFKSSWPLWCPYGW